MKFEDYEKAAQDTVVYPSFGENAVYPAMGLADEAGEVLGKVKKYLRVNGDDPRAADLKNDPSLRGAILQEMGDVLWYLALLARELDTSLEEVALINNGKLGGRKLRGTLHGDGDNR